MLPDKLAFVDIETSGLRAPFDRIIEIGILRVENNTLVKTFSSLLNPGTYIPPEIQRLTGIRPEELTNAPTFGQIKDEISELLRDCVFVAHNVRFDYSFIKSEFKREEHDFSSKHFCTVKLSKLLFPMQRRHNLDALIERYGFSCTNRHRAFDDAKVLYDFYTHIQSTIEPQTLLKAVDRALKKPSLPLHLKEKDLEALPESPGVYIFYADNKTPLYIGKSVNIKERVKSHFSADIHSSTEMKISQQIKSIETIMTAGELGALFLESALIKSQLPLYNRQLRLKRNIVVLKNKKDADGFGRLRLETVSDIKAEDIKSLQSDPDAEGIVGFFKSSRQAKEYLLKIAKEFELCAKLLGAEKSSAACFGYRLGNCRGACVGEEKSLPYNFRFTTALNSLRIKPWPYPGPIAIEEKNPLNGQKEYFVIDKWCYLGSVEYHGDLDRNSLKKDVPFDLDTYKILKRYLLSPLNQKRIRRLGLQEKALIAGTASFTQQ